MKCTTLNSEIESKLKRLWEDAFDLEDISVTENFFDLGGHSLVASQLISLVRSEFDVDLPLNVLFESPTIAGLAKAIGEAQTRGSVAQPKPCSQNGVLHTVGLDPLLPDPGTLHLPFPLTDIQHAYWMGRQAEFALGGVATHVYHETRVTDLNIAQLNYALNVVIVRHDMLRAIINSDGTQKILERVPEYKVRYVDLRKEATEARARKLASIRDELSHQVLDPSRWPVFEFRVTQVDDSCSHLHVSLDMLLVDAMSCQILMRELAQLYRDSDTVLPPLAVSFRDYVVAEQTLIDSPIYCRALNYWQSRLSELPSAPQLPLNKESETIRNQKFTRRKSILQADRWAILKAKAKTVGVTPSAVLLSAFAEVIACWSKDHRFTINLTLFNRLPLHPQVNDLIGDFTSLVLVGVNLDSSATFANRCRAVQAQLWRDLDHAAVGGIQVQRLLAKSHGLAQANMSVVFTSTLVNTQDEAEVLPTVRQEIANLFGNVVHSITQTPQVWLDHQVFEQDGVLTFHWDAVEELFPEGLLDDMFHTYCNLLTYLAEHDEVWEQLRIDLLPPSCHALQQAVNATNAPVSEQLLHDLFDKQANLAPSRMAVISKERNISYSELRDRAMQLGGALQSHNVRQNQLVAVVMDKGWEQVVSTLGILYSGAAYMPLDPQLPTERLHHILLRSEARIVLTQSHLDKDLTWPEDIVRISVDEQELNATASPLNTVRQSADNLAYVIYTSGSTGFPKGVMIDHRGAVNTVLDINDRFAMTPADRVLALSSLSFDLSVFDIFGTLAAGGTIIMPPPRSERDPSLLIELLEAEQVTVWNSVPALLNLLVEYAAGLAQTLPKSLRLVMLSGDWIPLALPKRLKSLLPSASVISLGGATEASIWSIYYLIAAVNPEWRSIPYGKPLRNQRVYVLDNGLNTRPVWVTGHLYIGGIGLAKGYWRDPERTNASFVDHPLTGERLYKTGDLGRYLPDGNIEFLGREDFQVKVQGFRIELGEIEAALESHPDVRNAIVDAQGEAQSEKRLVGYVVTREKQQITEEVFREYLSAKVPHYMVPSSFVLLDALPLSANGKVDRKALQTIKCHISASRSFEFRGPVEQRIVQIVEGILNTSLVSLETNLISAGATSLDFVRISNALLTEVGFRPKLDHFLRNPSVAALIEAYRQSQTANADRTTLPRNPSEAPTGLIDDALARTDFAKRQLGRRIFDSKLKQIELPISYNMAADTRFSLYRSVRRFDKTPIELTRFSSFLYCLAEGVLNEKPKYLYPSAGGLYPIQTYLYIKPSRIEGVSTGAYYYDSKLHRLITISEDTTLPSDIYDPFVNRPIFEDAAFALFSVSQMAAIEPMYGENSADFCHIEAGAIVQLLRMSAAEHQLGLCGIGIVDTDKLTSVFSLDSHHRAIFSMVGGKLPTELDEWKGDDIGVQAQRHSADSTNNIVEEFEI